MPFWVLSTSWFSSYSSPKVRQLPHRQLLRNLGADFQDLPVSHSLSLLLPLALHHHENIIMKMWLVKACGPVVISTTITEQAEPYRAPVYEPRPSVSGWALEKEQKQIFIRCKLSDVELQCYPSINFLCWYRASRAEKVLCPLFVSIMDIVCWWSDLQSNNILPWYWLCPIVLLYCCVQKESECP